MKFRLFLILMLLLIPATAFSISIGEIASDFVLKDMEGKEVTLKDFNGKVVFINFWATWCSPCKKEFPELNRFYDTYKDNDLIVLAVNSDLKKGSVEDFLTKYPAKMTVLLDPGAKIVGSYGPRAMPTSYIIDRKGVVRFIHFGFDEKNDPLKWVKEVKELLKEIR